MTGVAWYINDMKRKHEHAVRVQVRPPGAKAKPRYCTAGGHHLLCLQSVPLNKMILLWSVKQITCEIFTIRHKPVVNSAPMFKARDFNDFLSDIFVQHNCWIVSCTPAGDPVSFDQLEGCRPDHLWRACAGGNLSCSAGKEHSYSLPLWQDAAYYQEKRRALCLQDPHLGMTFFFSSIIDLFGIFFLPHDKNGK